MGEDRLARRPDGQHAAHRPHAAGQLGIEDIELTGVNLGQVPRIGMLVRQPVDEVRLQCFHAGVQLGQQRPHAPRGIRCGLGYGLGCGVLSGTVIGELGQVRVAAPLLEADMPLAPGHGLRIEQTRDREELGQGAMNVVGRAAGLSTHPHHRGAVSQYKTA